MLNTSKDLLLIVLAFCILWLTCFISWALYYMIVILRTAAGFVEDMKRRIDSVDRFIKLATEKLEHTSTALQLLVTGFERVSDYIAEKKTKRKPKSE